MYKIIQIIVIRFIFFMLALPLTVFAKSSALTKPEITEAFSFMGALNMAMGLVVVVALILGLAWVLKKYSKLPGVNQVDMKVLGGLSLGTREKAILIEVENKRLLVGVTPGHIQTLYVLDDKTERSSNESVQNMGSFQSKLKDALDVDK